MMTQLVDIRSLSGKTIAHACLDYDKSLLVFTDNTFIILRAKNGYEDDVTMEILLVKGLPNFSSEECIKLGVYTQEEYNAHHKIQEDIRKREVEVRELAVYERLRKKFNPKE